MTSSEKKDIPCFQNKNVTIKCKYHIGFDDEPVCGFHKCTNHKTLSKSIVGKQLDLSERDQSMIQTPILQTTEQLSEKEELHCFKCCVQKHALEYYHNDMMMRNCFRCVRDDTKISKFCYNCGGQMNLACSAHYILINGHKKTPCINCCKEIRDRYHW